MKKEELIKLLEDFHPTDELEIEYKAQILKFLEENNVFIGKENKNGHIVAGAWIVNQDMTKALMTFHAKLNKWFQVGGHTEQCDNDIIEAALREANEESGLSKLKLIKNGIFDIDVHSIPERNGEKEHFHYDIRFLFQANSNEVIVISNESKDLKWIDIDELLNYNMDASRMRMVEKTIKLRDR